VAGVIVHAGQALDHRRHARQRPQIGGEAVPLRAPHQGALDTRQLPGGKPRFSTSLLVAFKPSRPRRRQR